MTEQIHSCTMTSTSEIGALGEQLARLMKTHQLPEGLAFDITLIVDELLSNSLKYGGGNHFELTLYREPGQVRLQCHYNGVPFNPLLADKPDLTLPIEHRPIGGLGLELVSAVTSSQRYQHNGTFNCLTLTLPMPLSRK